MKYIKSFFVLIIALTFIQCGPRQSSTESSRSTTSTSSTTTTGSTPVVPPTTNQLVIPVVPVSADTNANAGIIDLNSTQEQRIALGCDDRPATSNWAGGGLTVFKNYIETRTLFGANSYDGNCAGKYADFYLQKDGGAFVVTKVVMAGWEEKYATSRDTETHTTDTDIHLGWIEYNHIYAQNGRAYAINYYIILRAKFDEAQDAGISLNEKIGEEASPLGRLLYIGKVSRTRGQEQARDVAIYQIDISQQDRIKIPVIALNGAFLAIQASYHQGEWHAQRGELSLMRQDANNLEAQRKNEVRSGQHLIYTNASPIEVFHKQIQAH
ncbi:MAG: hypothetical protein HYY62_08455 [Deltaproteobacteria bacterium]|nr:hypothetical protein [Deltaproteobacteria bacterium]